MPDSARIDTATTPTIVTNQPVLVLRHSHNLLEQQPPL
jgi:hypothetical protein